MQSIDQVETYLYLSRYRFTVDPVLVTLKIGREFVNTLVPVYEGGMRVRLPEESTKKIIHALQDGVEVGILVDGFEEKLCSAPFNLWAGERALPNLF